MLDWKEDPGEEGKYLAKSEGGCFELVSFAVNHKVLYWRRDACARYYLSHHTDLKKAMDAAMNVKKEIRE